MKKPPGFEGLVFRFAEMADWIRRLQSDSVAVRDCKHCSLTAMQVIPRDGHFDSTSCPNQQCTSFVGVFVIFLETIRKCVKQLSKGNNREIRRAEEKLNPRLAVKF
jgi:hypothetical protein